MRKFLASQTIFFDYNIPREIQDVIRGFNKLTLGGLSHGRSSKLKGEMDMAKKQSKFMQPMQVSDELAAVVGKGPMPRTEVTKKLWAYIKSRKLQDPNNRRNIVSDDKLHKVLGRKSVNMFEMTKLISKHLS